MLFSFNFGYFLLVPESEALDMMLDFYHLYVDSSLFFFYVFFRRMFGYEVESCDMLAEMLSMMFIMVKMFIAFKVIWKMCLILNIVWLLLTGIWAEV